MLSPYVLDDLHFQGIAITAESASKSGAANAIYSFAPSTRRVFVVVALNFLRMKNVLAVNKITGVY